jgi:hypothetical protein
MTAPAIQACLDRLVALWEELPREARPDGFWVAEHEVIRDFEYPNISPVNAAWYVDATGIHRRTLQDFLRFVRVQDGRTWLSHSPFIQTFAAFNCRKNLMHAVGIAHIGPTPESNVYYVDYQWGGLFGRGMLLRYHPEDGRFMGLANLWIS